MLTFFMKRLPIISTAEKVYEKLKTAPPDMAREVLDFLEFLEAKRSLPCSATARSFEDFFGVLKDSKELQGDPIEIQRKLRDEWA